MVGFRFKILMVWFSNVLEIHRTHSIHQPQLDVILLWKYWRFLFAMYYTQSVLQQRANTLKPQQNISSFLFFIHRSVVAIIIDTVFIFFFFFFSILIWWQHSIANLSFSNHFYPFHFSLLTIFHQIEVNWTPKTSEIAKQFNLLFSHRLLNFTIQNNKNNTPSNQQKEQQIIMQLRSLFFSLSHSFFHCDCCCYCFSARFGKVVDYWGTWEKKLYTFICQLN